MVDWDIRTVSGLDAAARALRDGRYPVGLLMPVRRQQCVAGLDSFLRRHGHLQWVAVFSPRDLDNAACRDLIVEHLCDYQPPRTIRSGWRTRRPADRPDHDHQRERRCLRRPRRPAGDALPVHPVAGP